MKPIWYFVGLILFSIGSIIFCTGVYLYFVPSPTTTVLAETHPNIWWGLVITIFGAGMYLKTKNDVVE
jgi:hypothetical protein